MEGKGGMLLSGGWCTICLKRRDSLPPQPMKRYALDRIGLYWEMKDEDTSEVLVRSSSKQAAILKATEVGIQTGGRLNIFKKNGAWECSRHFERGRQIRARKHMESDGPA